MWMSGGTGKDLLARIKKINCASLISCTKTLCNHIKRAHYIARIWRRAENIDLTAYACPMDYGLKLSWLDFLIITTVVTIIAIVIFDPVIISVCSNVPLVTHCYYSLCTP